MLIDRFFGTPLNLKEFRMLRMQLESFSSCLVAILVILVPRLLAGGVFLESLLHSERLTVPRVQLENGLQAASTGILLIIV